MDMQTALLIQKNIPSDVKTLSSEEIQAIEFVKKIKSRISECHDYLKNTDWYYARKLETEEAVPDDVIKKRLEARIFIREHKCY